MSFRSVYDAWNSVNIIFRILGGMIVGLILALTFPDLAAIKLMGEVFIGALKAMAPFVVFILILAALSKSRGKLGRQFRTVMILYIAGMMIAAALAVVFNFAFPIEVDLNVPSEPRPVKTLAEQLYDLVLGLIENPIDALRQGHYLAVLFWAVLFGLLMKKCAGESTLNLVSDMASIITKVIAFIISFAPFGIMGLVYSSICETSFEEFAKYFQIALLLVAVMLVVMFVTNPLLVYLTTRRNPYPLLFRCIKSSAITAFFTRSSAANIPINMKLAEDMNLDEDFYSVSIPLGATINMSGAAITVSTLALITAFSYGVEVSIPMAVILCIISAIAACGSSGVAGGSLLLVPLACSMFGIPDDIAFKVVAIGFVIGIIQDSMETALNSSTDVYFTAAADIRNNPEGDFRI